MAKEIKGARFVLKRSNVVGETPTIPPNNDHTTGLWIDTDIYSGEMFLNVADSKMWFRNSSAEGTPAGEMVQLVPLNSGGTIDTNYLPGNYLGAMIYQGVWDASTGNPPSLTPEKGDYWIVSVSGNTDLDGHTDWQIGDFPIYNGATWDKIDNSEPTILSTDVVYSHSYYTGFTNVSDSLDFLLDEYNTIIQGTNIIISNGTHTQTISVVNAPTFSGNVTAAGLIAQTGGLSIVAGGASIAGGMTISSGGASITGALGVAGHITTSLSGDITGNKLQATSGRIDFNTSSQRIEADGTSIRFYQNNILRLEFDNPTGIATTYSKMRYDVSKTFTDNRDFVDKGYLDYQIGIHNVGLWSSGGTILNPYQIVAYDGGINTHYVGINVQNPTSALHIDGDITFEHVTSTTRIISNGNAVGSEAGNDLKIKGGIGTVGQGGNVYIEGGDGADGGNRVYITGGVNTSGAGNGGNVYIEGGAGPWGEGSIFMNSGVITNGNITVIGNATLGDGLTGGDLQVNNNLTVIGTSTLSTTNITGTMAATTVTGANVTSGSNPGHTHTTSYVGNDDTGDTNCPIVFVANSTAGYKSLYEDSLVYIDNTANNIHAAGFTGNLTGNVSGSAGTVVTQQSTISANRYFIWTDSGTDNTAKTLYTDSAATCYINPSTNTIGATYLSAYNLTVTNSINLGASDTIYFGTATDKMEIYVSSSFGYIELYNNLNSLNIRDGITNQFRFDITAGDFHATGDVIAYSAGVSDIRLKENIEPLENSLDKILNLQGISYDRKLNGENHIGFIAQELEKVLPNLINETTLPLETGDEETVYKTIRYTEVIPYLVEAIKELKSEIEELKR